MTNLVENERFPMGLRVLVVDDDITCLKLMDNLLKKCHYRVTTTNQAREALKLLKENNNKFDIVITDVEMPDMNGIKLLQLVGLEMNLPVIMLSAYSDTKRVMQGVRNGACDYLVKPVRIQELQNIWQHVVRRNKLIPLRGAASVAKNRMQRGEGTEESSGDDDNDEMEEDSRGNKDPATQKKPRLFWSVELHQKFVDAVDQLGPDKAFPKKILDLMNVEGLTREKVASHLQKYRLYLRKVNSGSSLQPGNRHGSIGDVDAHIGPLGGGYGIYRSITSLPQQACLRDLLNTTDGLFSLRDLSSSPMVPNSSNSNNFGKFEPSSFSANQNTISLCQGIPTTMQINKPSLLSPSTDGTPPLNARELSNQSSLVSPFSNIGATGVGAAANFKARWGASVQPATQSFSCPQNQSIQNDPLDFFNGTSSVNELKGNEQNQGCLNGPESLQDVLGRFLKQV